MSKDKFSEIFDLKLIASGVVLFLLLALLSYGIPSLKPFFVSTEDKDKTAGKVIESKFTKENIEEAKKNPIPQQPAFEKTAIIIDKPIPTPVFVSNPDKLTDYLFRISQGIVAEGEIKVAYLYINTGSIDLENESVYFYMVDGKGKGGHLVPTESLIPNSGTEFLYDMSKLPFVQLPYSLKKPIDHFNMKDEILNFEPQNTERKYYIGAFVSTTRLPNQVEKVEIRYSCEINTFCEIKVI